MQSLWNKLVMIRYDEFAKPMGKRNDIENITSVKAKPAQK